jgi:hypothetical protein
MEVSRLAVLSLLAFSVLTAQTTVPPPRKILFIGDSLTYYHDGIYSHLEKLAAAALQPLELTTGKAVSGGAYLKRLWDMQGPLKAIQTGGYDVVVRQEDLPETTVADFVDSSRRFVAEIRTHQARPILLMAWAYPRLGWISMDGIAEAHRDLAKELKVEVAPVGMAWQRAAKERPDLNLYAPDGEHPSIHGTYLATCVVYATIYGRNPIDTTYVAFGITPEEAGFLRRIASEESSRWSIVHSR